MRKAGSPATASAQITNRWLQAPLIIWEKSNAESGGSPPNSDAFWCQNVIASSVSRSSPASPGSGLSASGIRSRSAWGRAADRLCSVMDRTHRGLLRFASKPYRYEFSFNPHQGAVMRLSHLSLEEAATLPCAAVTAWVALTGNRRITAGDTVLTQGSGGVSVFALQFAQILGARVIATTSTAEKAERLKALGASDVINYTETPNWDEKARELTDGRGVDCVVEIGGPGTIAMSLKALAVGGHVSLIGASLSRSGTGLDPLLLTGRGITLGSISVGSRTDFETMNRAIAMHRLHPVIDRTFPFAEAKDAYRHFEARGHFGKVVITHG